MLSVMVADNLEIIRSGIKQILSTQDDIHVTQEASSFKELISFLQKDKFDILILDLNLGDKNGVQVIREVSDKFGNLPMIVVSMLPEDPYALKSIEAGASAYICKTSHSDEIITAIESIKRNEKYLNPVYRETLLLGTKLEKTKKSAISSLSSREYEVYMLIATGMKFKDIARKLGISPKTVSTYRTRILSKLSLDSTTQLIHFALQNYFGK